MRLFVKDRNFYKSFFSLTGVIALQNLISFAVNLADNIMIGDYSQTALSGVAIVNQVQFLLQMIILGIGSGITVLCAQYWGKKQAEPIRRVTTGGMLLALGVGVLFTVATFLFPSQTLSVLTNETAVISEGVKYMQILCWSFALYALTNTLLYALRSVETARIGFVVTVAALVINVFLNYCLIEGNLGFPEMGVQGAAVATLISRVVEFAIVVVYTCVIDKKIRWKPLDLFRVDKKLFADYLRVGMPVIASETMWGIAMAAQTAILGRLGDNTIAANSIATTIFQVISVVSFGSASAAGVLIGKTVGERDIPRVKAYTKTLQVIFVGIGILTGATLWLSKDWILGFYNSINPDTYALTLRLIGILSVTVVGTSYQVACLPGIVTGGGDTKFVLINDLIHQWLIVIPAAFLSAFVFDLPVEVTFLCLKADQILKCVVAAIKVNRYRWIRILTRDN